MSIAVAHHDTPEGRAALSTAVAEARLRATELVVLHIQEVTIPDAEAGAHLDEHVRREIGDTDVVTWRVETVASGRDTAQALVDLVIETGATILVIGAKRRSPVGKLFLGSTVQRVVLDCPVPVLVVKAEA